VRQEQDSKDTISWQATALFAMAELQALETADLLSFY